MVTYKYRFAEPIEKSLLMKIGESYLLQESYEETVTQMTQRGIQAPILSFSEGGFLSLSLDHQSFHRNDIHTFDPNTKIQIIRLNVTELKPPNKFDPIVNVEPEFISVYPEKSVFKMRIAPIQSIYESSSKDDLKQILLDEEKLSTNKSNICTHILITEQIANIIIDEFKRGEPVEPLDLIYSINRHLAKSNISRSTTGKIKISSNNAKELMKFLLLAHHLWNQTEEDENYIDETDIKSFCPTVICPDAITDPDLRSQMQKHKLDTLENIVPTPLHSIMKGNTIQNHKTPPPSAPPSPSSHCNDTDAIPRKTIDLVSTPSPQTICKSWTLTGSCTNGPKCPNAFSHIEANPKEKFLLSILRATSKEKPSIKTKAETDFDPPKGFTETLPSLSQSDLINFKVSSVLDRLVDRLDTSSGTKESTQGFHSWPDNSKTAMSTYGQQTHQNLSTPLLPKLKVY